MHTTRPTLLSFLGAAVLALAACGGSLPTSVPSIAIPTLPVDGIPSGTAECVDAPTMAIFDQLRATGADLPTVLAANEDVLIAGLGELESSDPTTIAWRDALIDALESGDMDAAAAEIAKLADGEITIATW
jgi:hypothetical protein